LKPNSIKMSVFRFNAVSGNPQCAISFFIMS
jgi:hypothetical protein